MKLEDYLEFIGPDAIRIRGHRIGIEHVLAYYREGYSPEAIAQELPGLSVEKVYATITYYLHNRAEVDSYLTRLAQHSEQEYQAWAVRPSPSIERLRATKAQREQEQHA